MTPDPHAPVQEGTWAAGWVRSADERCRYLLWRAWDEDAQPTLSNAGDRPWVTFCGLNPSTASHLKADATVRRWTGYAKDWGCGGFFAVNLFALRSTDPNALLTADSPIGVYTDAWIHQALQWSQTFVACWGAHKAVRHYARDRAVYDLASATRIVQALKVTKDGFPSHPLRLRRDLELIPWSPPWTGPGPLVEQPPATSSSDAAASLREQQDSRSQRG